jgi:hypothetical protein
LEISSRELTTRAYSFKSLIVEVNEEEITVGIPTTEARKALFCK